MKIVKITAEWDNGRKYSIEEPEVTEFLKAGGSTNIYMYLLLSFALNMAGGFAWREEC